VRVLEQLVPDYIEACMFHYLLEAKAAEQRSRMTAMKVATDNADEMIAELTLEANRLRQTSITREISEIVGGTEALR
jgi:F-type H+-transporting ATPase subunit gamma